MRVFRSELNKNKNCRNSFVITSTIKTKCSILVFLLLKYVVVKKWWEEILKLIKKLEICISCMTFFGGKWISSEKPLKISENFKDKKKRESFLINKNS